MENILKAGARLALRHASHQGVDGYIMTVEYQKLYITIAALSLEDAMTFAGNWIMKIDSADDSVADLLRERDNEEIRIMEVAGNA